MKKIYIIYLFLLSAPLLMSTSTPVHYRYVAPYKTVAQAGIVIDGNNMYIADNDDLVSYDISQPASPVETGREHLREGIDTLYMYRQYLVVCQDNYFGTVVFDVTGGTFNRSGINWMWGSCNKVALNENKAFVADKPGYSCTGEQVDHIVGIYNLNGTVTDDYVTSFAVGNVKAMVANGQALYVSDESKGLKVVDLATNDVKTAGANMNYYQLKIAGNKLYARTASSLDCYDISNALRPTLISQLSN